MNRDSTGIQQFEPLRWIEEHADILYRYSLIRLGSTELAEDMVQETLLSALQAQKRFKGQSSVRTWLIGILKNKIIDYYRRQKRDTLLSDMEASGNSVEDELGLFNQKGMWQNHKPDSWSNPKEALEQKEFWEIFKRCKDGLPERLADAFTLRELENLSSEEICQVLNITATNYWAMMHRARVYLRQCLEKHWFNQST